MSEGTKAVFLSYASQDSEAAKRICDALRAAGIEVWFDQSELVGGDAWDAKIRGQIKECALFVPIISATTNARREGYFRREWKLAVDRTHDMDEALPFLLPVVIDGTTDAGTFVPEKFREVQWTRLPAGETPEKFCERVKRVLAGGATPVSDRRSGVDAKFDAGPKPASPRKRTTWPLLVLAAFAVAGTAYFALRPGRSVPAMPAAVPGNPVTSPGAPEPAALATVATFPRDPELRRAWKLFLDTPNNTTEDFALAEDIVKAAAARRPTDPEVVIVYAWLNDTYLNRGFDLSEERHVLGRRYAERAVQLAPNDPEALAAFGQFLSFRGADPVRAEQLLRRAIELNPHEARFYRALAYNVLRRSHPAEALQVTERAAELFPQDPLVLYELGLLYRDAGRFEDMDQAYDRCLTLAPLGSALLWKAWIAAWIHGDVPGMKHWLDQLSGAARLSDRALIVRYEAASLTRDPTELADALRALQAFPGSTLRDFWYAGPKALLLGDLYAAQGQPELAKGQYELALAEVSRQKTATPDDFDVLVAETSALIGLGRRQEALAALHVRSSLILADDLPRSVAWWFAAVPGYLLLGDRADALPLLKRITTTATLRNQVRTALRIDPRMAAWRADPEINALVTEPEEKPEPAAAGAMADNAIPAEKSVAVLAFANLSDDKANEYFSDGISEELLNVLAKIPGLKVSARTSAFYFKGKEVPVPEIAKQLGVAFVVEGSVRKQGDKVRITAQLIKAADGFHVWSDTFTRDLKDIFAVQDEIAGLIAKNLEVKMGMVAARPTIDLEAYQEYLAGRALFAKAGNGDLQEAVRHFEKAVAIEPKFTAAWVQLASAHTQLGRWGGAPTLPSWAAARAAIDRAVALEPDSPDVLLALGWIRRTADWDWRGAEQAFRQSLQLRPDQPDALAGLAVLLFNIGQKEEAFRLGQQAALLDPLNPATQIDLSLMFYLNSNLAEAERSARRALQLAPGGAGYHCILAWSLIKQGRLSEAEAQVGLDSDAIERPLTYGLLALARDQSGVAREKLTELEEIARKDSNLADLQNAIAWIAVGLGEKDRPFAALAKARDSRDPSNAWLRSSPYLDPLHSDPRWDALLHKVGLADDQLK